MAEFDDFLGNISSPPHFEHSFLHARAREWIVDTGATTHMCFASHSLRHLSQLSVHTFVDLPDIKDYQDSVVNESTSKKREDRWHLFPLSHYSL